VFVHRLSYKYLIQGYGNVAIVGVEIGVQNHAIVVAIKMTF